MSFLQGINLLNNYLSTRYISPLPGVGWAIFLYSGYFLYVDYGYFVLSFWDFEFARHQNQSYVFEKKFKIKRSRNHMDLTFTQTTLKLPTLNVSRLIKIFYSRQNIVDCINISSVSGQYFK